MAQGTQRAVRPWWALAVLCLALLVVTIQTSILNVALPTLVRELGASDTQLQWIVDSYVVAFAGLLLTGAALADRYGRRRVMVIGLVVCAVGAVGSGLSGSPAALIGWRTVMGLGGALVLPATLSILVNVFTDPGQRSRAIAYWSLMNATGAFIGPVAGGLLLKVTGWQACFVVTLPFILVGVVLAQLLVPDSRDPSAARFDVPGAVLSTLALAALVWSVIEGPTYGWSDPRVVGGFVIALVALVLFGVWESRTSSPMIDLKTFANPQLSAAALALTIAFLAITSAMYLTTLALQQVKGYLPLQAAVATSVPITVVNFLVVPRAPRLIRRFGTRVMVSAGTAVIAVASLIISTMTRTSSYWPLFLGFALMALAFSTFLPAATEAMMTAVPPERSGGASAVNQLTRQIGQALGVALAGGVAAMGYRAHFDGASLGLSRDQLATASNSLGGALSVVGHVPQAVGAALLALARDAYVHGVRMMLYVTAGLAVVGSVYAAWAIPSKHPKAELALAEGIPEGRADWADGPAVVAAVEAEADA
jgi:EmrB/QacA subfamily drug resistance transporter